MIIRIVKMEFEPSAVDDFLKIFATSRNLIRSFEGCQHLQLLQDESDPCVFFTYSHWDTHEHLDAYRTSPLFEAVWANTKKLFRVPAQAWSTIERTQE